MRWRDFIAGLAMAASWPLTAAAQQPAVPVVGFLHPNSRSTAEFSLAAFRRGLDEMGYVEGRNVSIDYRWAEGHYDQLPALAGDLVQRQVSVIFAAGGASVFAAKAATASIPIVFLTAIDPVQAGFVSSLNRPNGNLTGIGGLNTAATAKQLEILHELIPSATSIGLLVNPMSLTTPVEAREVKAAAPVLGLQVFILDVTAPTDFEAIFTRTGQQGTSGVLVSSDTFFTNWREQVVAAAARHAVPAIYQFREFALAGGLVSYGARLSDLYREGALYVARILSGVKPVDLPVQQSTKLELVINLKTAKALGLTIPEALLDTADEVIQ
jgi:putative tryptophan/tyrosine transport system substrate-binding protein